MKLRDLKLAVASLICLLIVPGVAFSASQNTGSSGPSASSPSNDSSNSSSKGQGGQNQSTPSATNGSGSTVRIESQMIAYEASDQIAAQIASHMSATKVLVYDSQTFTSLQAYEAYTSIVSTLESAMKMGTAGTMSFGAAATAAQTVVSTLSALRSSTEYATQPVNLDTDALTAQIIARLSGKTQVILPQILLLNTEDLKAFDASDVDDENCSSLDKTVPAQLACLLNVRDEMEPEPDSLVDKVFQLFWTSIMGTSSTTTSKATDQGNAPADGAPPQTGAPTPNAPSNGPPSLMLQIVQGHRLKQQLTSGAHVLVIEATAAGGSYRIRHNFWVELFYTTPTPSFNGGAVVTYMLIDPATSVVEQSEVLRYM